MFIHLCPHTKANWLTTEKQTIIQNFHRVIIDSIMSIFDAVSLWLIKQLGRDEWSELFDSIHSLVMSGRLTDKDLFLLVDKIVMYSCLLWMKVIIAFWYYMAWNFQGWNFWGLANLSFAIWFSRLCTWISLLYYSLWYCLTDLLWYSSQLATYSSFFSIFELSFSGVHLSYKTYEP